MLNIGFGEMLILAAIALIVLGPKDLPKLARVLGRTVGELRKAIRDVTSTMTSDVTADWRRPQIRKDFQKAPTEISEPEASVETKNIKTQESDSGQPTV